MTQSNRVSAAEKAAAEAKAEAELNAKRAKFGAVDAVKASIPVSIALRQSSISVVAQCHNQDAANDLIDALVRNIVTDDAGVPQINGKYVRPNS